jgi:hypothetical protein
MDWNWRLSHQAELRHDREEMNATGIRVLRWVYSHQDNSLTCELRLADDGLSYQLTTTPGPQPATPTIERFRDATAAFQRQCELERKLVATGWSLESYESQVRVDEADRAEEPSGSG